MIVIDRDAILDGNISKVLIERALSKLLSNESLRLSDRNRKFIHFVVKEVIAGRGERIKAYSIGVDVFGRGEDFDPNIDPIVRIEATRLRSALEAYYSGPGANDDVKIIMRPGSYVPVFEGPSLGASPNRPRLVASAPVPLPSRPIVVSHGTDPRNRQAYTCGALLVNALAQKLIGKSYRVFFGSLPNQKGRGRSIKDIMKCHDSVICIDISILPITGGRRHVWSISDLETGEVCSLGDMDQVSDELTSASWVSELTDRIFRSVTSVMDLATAARERSRRL
ncbi:hypothetical protein ACMDCR_03020 [Labrys okinawensis]|uniref:hypothetical protein n=1 Tax=Labrys okinawensis TaxID=346911 RepID=UPI0039BD578D